MDLRFLVTGTGRCGTVFAARLLTSVGIPCGHETIFVPQGLEVALAKLQGQLPLSLSTASMMRMDPASGSIVDEDAWVEPTEIVAESSYMAAPFLRSESLGDPKIIHIVRHPVRVVNSFCNYINYFSGSEPTNGYESFIYQNFPELKAAIPRYDRACLYYILWNQLIESASPDLFYRVEDRTDEILAFLGADQNAKTFQNNTINTFRKIGSERFTLHKVQSDEIKKRFVDIGERYGYTMSSEYLLI